MSQERAPSVKERKSYFETLGACNTVSPKSIDSSRKQRPLSEISFSTDHSKIPPQKPKRTFEHNIYLEIGSLSANTRLGTRSPIMLKYQSSIETNNNNNSPTHDFPKISFLKVSDVPYYAVSPFPLRRYHSHEELYATPITQSDRNPNGIGAKHHQKLYYASVSVRDGKELSKELTRESDRCPTLLRKYAFKRQKKHKAQGRCEVPLSKLHDARALSVNLDRRSSRAQIVRRSTLIHKAKVEEFCSQADPRLFEAAFVISLQEDLVPGTTTLKPYPTIQYGFPENIENESVYAKAAVLFYPDYSHQRKIEPDELQTRDEELRSRDEEFMIAITDFNGSRRYAYCIRYLPSFFITEENEGEGVYPQVVVVISPIRNSIFYMHLVRNICDYAKQGNELLDRFLHSVHRNAYSPKQGWSLMVGEKRPNGAVRNIEIKNYGQTLGKAGSAAIIQRITPEVTVCLVAALLGEQRILIAGNSVGETEAIHSTNRVSKSKYTACSITRVVQMLEALIRPLCWPHTFIPIVPDNLLDLCDNPTPYLMGILRSNLNRVKELIVESKDDDDRRQMDFIFVDIDAGVVVPAPDTAPTACNEKSLETWRYENAIKFCEKMGWSRKMSVTMIKGFRDAITSEPAAAADLKCENVMLKWYAELFGHYRFVGAHQMWNNDSKELLVSGQPVKEYRPYLNYLKETIMFEDWILSRVPSDKNREIIAVDEEPLPGSEDDLNCRIDKYWITDFNSLAPKELRRLANRVTNALGLWKRH